MPWKLQTSLGARGAVMVIGLWLVIAFVVAAVIHYF